MGPSLDLFVLTMRLLGPSLDLDGSVVGPFGLNVMSGVQIGQSHGLVDSA